MDKMNSAKTPTPKQVDVLIAIRAGQVRMCNTGYASFRIGGPAHPSVVGRCVSLGWAKWPLGAIGDDQTCELTDAGQAVLAAAMRKEG